MDGLKILNQKHKSWRLVLNFIDPQCSVFWCALSRNSDLKLRAILELKWGASSRWLSSSLYFPMRSANQKTIGKTYPTLDEEKKMLICIKIEHLTFGNILIELQILTDISKTDCLYLTTITNKYFCISYLVSAPWCYRKPKWSFWLILSLYFPTCHNFTSDQPLKSGF